MTGFILVGLLLFLVAVALCHWWPPLALPFAIGAIAALSGGRRNG